MSGKVEVHFIGIKVVTYNLISITCAHLTFRMPTSHSGNTFENIEYVITVKIRFHLKVC